MIVFTVNEHKNICIAGLNRQAGYATVYPLMFETVFELDTQYAVYICETVHICQKIKKVPVQNKTVDMSKKTLQDLLKCLLLHRKTCYRYIQPDCFPLLNRRYNCSKIKHISYVELI